jgi:hypothetical protein
MSGCRRTRDKILASLYGELSPEGEKDLSRHLESCAACRAEHDAMARTLLTMGAKKAADPGPEYWATYFDKLEKRMAAENADASAPILAAPAARLPFRNRLFPRWAFAAAGAAALLAAGILIGRLSAPRGILAARIPSSAERTETLPAAADGSLSERTSRYFDRSKVILLAIVNFDPGTKDIAGLNLPVQKTMSQELVREAALLKDDLREARERRLERLVGELETILVQIANLKSETALPGVEIVKSGVDLKDILFKINLSEARISARASEPPAKPAAKI